jgi:hypothetical protein
MANDIPGVEPIRAVAVEPSIDGIKVVYTTTEARSDSSEWHYLRRWKGYRSEYLVTHVSGREWVFPTLIAARRWTYSHGHTALEIPARDFP